MSSPTYYSAVYIINRSKQNASRVCLPDYECEFLPNQIKLKELADLVADMQKICFKDENKKNENSERLYDMFMATTERTVAVALTLGYKKGVIDYKEFVDGGSATIQMSSQGVLPTQQPWLNEVCRSKRILKKITSPVIQTMDLIDKYIRTTLMKKSKKVNGIYLYVEKSPEHGEPEFLLEYYKKYGFKEFLLGNKLDKEYYYMKKMYVGKSPSLRKAKSISVNKTRKSKSTSKAYSV
jgi:hypothetical protein